MSKQRKTFGQTRSTKHTKTQHVPHRVASRLEGVVKNRGIKPKKKEPKQ